MGVAERGYLETAVQQTRKKESLMSIVVVGLIGDHQVEEC